LAEVDQGATPPDGDGWVAPELWGESDAQLPEDASALGGGVEVVSVVVAGAVLVVPVVPVVVVSALGGADVVDAPDEAGVVEAALESLQVLVVPVVVPVAGVVLAVGVVDWASTVASVWVCVRPGGGVFDLVASPLVVAVPVCLVAVLSGAFCAVVATVLVAAGLCRCAGTG
jgi:hypothetical protein